MTDRIQRVPQPAGPDSANDRRDDWLEDSLLSGFAATFAMTVVLALAYGFASAVGDRGGGTVAHWFWALVHNPVTRETKNAVFLAIALNLVMGLVWGVVYGRLAEPLMRGPGWQRGLRFALIPWILSVIAFLPVMGGGFLGFGIGAGPLPLIGNLILHLIYGAVLGGVYALATEKGLVDTEEEREAAICCERGAAVGIVAGVILGAIAGWAMGPNTVGINSSGGVILAVALVGGAIGVLLGSLLGLNRAEAAVVPRR